MVKPTLLKRRYSNRINIGWKVMLGGSNSSIQAADIGDGGMRVHIEGKKQAVSVNQPVEITLQSHQDTFVFQGKVVWVNAQNGTEMTQCGVKFADVPPQLKSKLQKAIYFDSNYVQELVVPIFPNGSQEKAKDEIQQVLIVDLPLFIRELIEYQKEVETLSDYSSIHEHKLVESSEKLLKKLHSLERLINDKSLIKQVRRVFQTATANWSYQSRLVRWGYEKPLGYPGDYKMLELIYNNKHISNGFGSYWDGYFLSDPYAEGVRNRKDIMKDFLRELFERRSKHSLRILNMACGSSREIRELIEVKNLSVSAEFTCIDQDQEALDFSQEQLSKFKTTGVSFNFLRENILDCIRHPEKHILRLGNQDLVYSIGLADYFPDKILCKFLKFCYNLAIPGGYLVLAHKDCDTHEPLAPRWYCDWEFVPRNEKYFEDLIKQAGITELVETLRENTGHIFFTIIRKSKGD